MKVEDLPEWVKDYKKKGYQIRLVKNTYCLYKVTSIYDKEKKYPKLVQEYVGVIDKDYGLINKKTKDYSSFIEYGLSNVIIHSFNRTLQRSLFNNTNKPNDYIIRLAIVYYLFNTLDKRILSYSYISNNNIDKLASFIKTTKKERIINLSKKIDSLLQEKFKEDKDYYVSRLKLLVINKNINNPNDIYPLEILKILKEKGLKYE